MSSKTEALDLADPGAGASSAFITIAIMAALILLGAAVLKGGSDRHEPTAILSEEERLERRKKALRRFGNASEGGGDRESPDSADADRLRNTGAFRHRATAKDGVRPVDSRDAPGSSDGRGIDVGSGKVRNSNALKEDATGPVTAPPTGTWSNTIADKVTDAAEQERTERREKALRRIGNAGGARGEDGGLRAGQNAVTVTGHDASSANICAPPKKNNKNTKVAESGEEPVEEVVRKQRRPRPAPPPAQLLCEALSVVCGTQVTVTPGHGPWGGEGWIGKKRAGRAGRLGRMGSSSPLSPRRKKMPKIALPLVRQQRVQGAGASSADQDEWAQLDSALRAIVASSSSAMNRFRNILPVAYSKQDIATAAAWHAKTHGTAARDVIEDIILAFGPGNDETATLVIREGLGRCLSTMAIFVSRVIALWLEKDPAQEDDDSDEEDLFSDDYKTSAAQAATISALGEFVELCAKPDAALILPKRFFGDVFAQSSDGARLAQKILERALARLPGPDGTSASFETVAKDLAAVSHLVANSTDVAVALSEKMNREVVSSTSGNAFELASILRSLLCLGGYTLFPVGFEKRMDFELLANDQSSSSAKGDRFYEALKSIEAFPLGYFAPSREDPSMTKVIDEARSIMKQARFVTGGVLRNCMRRKGGRDDVLSWLGRLVHANDMHANLLQEQLFDEKDDVHGSLSSRPFVMGTALSTLEMCSRDLVQNYEKNGTATFDARYLLSTKGSLIMSPDERRLIDLGGDSGAEENIPRTFSGATELFFLTSALLRISVFSALRNRDEYSQRYRNTISRIQQLARNKDRGNAAGGGVEGVMEAEKKIVAGFLGWNTCLDDPELIGRMVDFCVLQLRFLAGLSKRNGQKEALLSFIPESMVKLPSRYIADIAARFQRHLSPTQAEDAVKYATILLGSDVNLSIQVQTELIRISGAFVRAGVQRAAARKRRASRRHGTKDDDGNNFDMRDLDIYSSLDRNDHGVVVFASPAASKQLGPILLQTFVAMEAVEGLDVEREHNLHKNMVHGEICELILRLWAHPSGAFRCSIASLGSNALDKFFKAVVASINMECNTVHQTILDIRDVLEDHVEGHRFSMRERGQLNSSYRRLPSFLGAMRRLLLLLSYLSQDERIASLLGGSTDDNTVSSDLGNTVVSLLDKFTASDGGTHPLVDFRVALKNSTNMASSQTSSSTTDRIKDLVGARTFAKAEFGIDVSVLAHLLMALATRWALAASKQGPETPTIVKAITRHDDFSIQHFQTVFNRLVVATQSATGDENSVVKSDGHVDPSQWMCYETPCGIGLEESRGDRNYSSRQDQLSHPEIEGIAGVDQIASFLSMLGRDQRSADLDIGKSDEDILQLECRLLRGQSQTEEGYAQSLQDWVVSSDTFTDHFYKSNAKASNHNIGKVLLKDARKCWKDLPRPHPNASIFVCYSEERMDVCKAVIIGAGRTPYSMGIFVFDICYPQLYPSAAPLVHFMTTGGGQVRFSPNLYNDGKVCISLLGTTNAWDESQRWNPTSSSLAQVLLSIQSQILDIEQPYFAEGGGHEGVRGTRAGQRGSARYNNTLRLSTLRHAIIEPLKSPPIGFEDVTRRHFAMCRKRLMVQAKLWTMESIGTELHGRFVKAYSELLLLLSSDKLSCEDWELADAGGDIFGALPPLSSDLVAFRRLDPNLCNAFESMLQPNGSDQPNGYEDGEESS